MINRFIELVRQYQRAGMVVAEVGCFDGTTSEGWMPIVQSNQGVGILVDYFQGNPGVTAGNPHGQISYDQSGTMVRLFERVRSYPRFVMIKGDSAASAALIANQSVDICFIDADHRYSGITRDLDAWIPKLKPTGILCGHDCDSLTWDERWIEGDMVENNHHGVAKALTERFRNIRLIGESVWQVDDLNRT